MMIRLAILVATLGASSGCIFMASETASYEPTYGECSCPSNVCWRSTGCDEDGACVFVTSDWDSLSPSERFACRATPQPTP